MRWDIINQLIEDNGYRSYLELGTYNRADNFNKIKCKTKFCVDLNPKSKPDYAGTTDSYFEQNTKTWDLVFVDADHECSQVLRDINNALSCLAPSGTIVVHDCNPTTEAMQIVPRMQGEWTGDVWKAWQELRATRSDLKMFVYDVDYGVGIIQRGEQVTLKHTVKDYTGFDLWRESTLNLISYGKTVPLSICIPAFEQYGFGESTLTNLLESLKDQQGEFEIIVSDNSGNLKEICSKYPKVQYYFNPIKGISENTNFAISKAKYDHIKLMYQDDMAYPGMVKEFSKALAVHPWVISQGFAINEKCVKVRPTHPRYTENVIRGKNTVGMPSVCGFKKNNIKFDTNLLTLLDCEFYWQLYNAFGNPYVIRKKLIGSRYWNGSTSRKQGNHTDKEWLYLQDKWPQLRS